MSKTDFLQDEGLHFQYIGESVFKASGTIRSSEKPSRSIRFKPQKGNSPAEKARPGLSAETTGWMHPACLYRPGFIAQRMPFLMIP
jgi:hypothetical protein